MAWKHHGPGLNASKNRFVTSCQEMEHEISLLSILAYKNFMHMNWLTLHNLDGFLLLYLIFYLVHYIILCFRSVVKKQTPWDNSSLSHARWWQEPLLKLASDVGSGFKYTRIFWLEWSITHFMHPSLHDYSCCFLEALPSILVTTCDSVIPS